MGQYHKLIIVLKLRTKEREGYHERKDNFNSGMPRYQNNSEFYPLWVISPSLSTFIYTICMKTLIPLIQIYLIFPILIMITYNYMLTHDLYNLYPLTTFLDYK